MKAKKIKQKLNKPTIFFLILFIGFVLGIIIGLGLQEIIYK
jgi:hypothetical protein